MMQSLHPSRIAKLSVRSMFGIGLVVLFLILTVIASIFKSRMDPESFHTQLQILKSQFRELQQTGKGKIHRGVTRPEDQALLRSINERLVRKDSLSMTGVLDATEKDEDNVHLKAVMSTVKNSLHVQAMADFEEFKKVPEKGKKKLLYIPEFEAVLVGAGRKQSRVIDSVVSHCIEKRNWRVFVFESNMDFLRKALLKSLNASGRCFGIHAIPGPNAGHEWQVRNPNANNSYLLEMIPEYPVIETISAVGFRNPFLFVVHDVDVDNSLPHILDAARKFASSFKPHVVLIESNMIKDRSSKMQEQDKKKLSDSVYLEKVMKLAGYYKMHQRNSWIPGYDIYYSKEYFKFVKRQGVLSKKSAGSKEED
jgi:hypothetical protein